MKITHKILGKCPYLANTHTAKANFDTIQPPLSEITYCVYTGGFDCDYADECTYIREDNRTIEDCPLFIYANSNTMPL